VVWLLQPEKTREQCEARVGATRRVALLKETHYLRYLGVKESELRIRSLPPRAGPPAERNTKGAKELKNCPWRPSCLLPFELYAHERAPYVQIEALKRIIVRGM